MSELMTRTMQEVELELQSVNFELIQANTRAAELSARKTRLEGELHLLRKQKQKQ